MPRAKRQTHVCQYNQPCAACAARGNVQVKFDPKTLERIAKNRARGCVECTTLPQWYPGADSYTKDGRPQFETLGKLAEAGKRYGLAMR